MEIQLSHTQLPRCWDVVKSGAQWAPGGGQTTQNQQRPPHTHPSPRASRLQKPHFPRCKGRQWQSIPEGVTFSRSTLHVSRSVEDKNLSESQRGMEAHHSLDYTENLRGWGRGRGRGRKGGEGGRGGGGGGEGCRERVGERTQSPPFKST